MPTTLALLAGITCAALLLAAAILHLLPKLGLRAITNWLARAPGLDLAILYFTVAPQVVGIAIGVVYRADLNPWLAALLGLVAAVAAQILAVLLWGWTHELFHLKAARGPRIVHQLNRTVGRFRNHAAVWWTAWAAPVFAIVRVAEVFVYTPLTWLVRLPKYRTADWVNVSRHKFDGLVGHDLIWCLYCDWMTGVWSLATEMLRNVESFWCPIRFDSTKKCENCRIDFPDIDHGWVRADGDMGQVVALLADKYKPGQDQPWFSHPARLTVDGREPASQTHQP